MPTLNLIASGRWDLLDSTEQRLRRLWRQAQQVTGHWEADDARLPRVCERLYWRSLRRADALMAYRRRHPRWWRYRHPRQLPHGFTRWPQHWRAKLGQRCDICLRPAVFRRHNERYCAHCWRGVLDNAIGHYGLRAKRPPPPSPPPPPPHRPTTDERRAREQRLIDEALAFRWRLKEREPRDTDDLILLYRWRGVRQQAKLRHCRRLQNAERVLFRSLIVGPGARSMPWRQAIEGELIAACGLRAVEAGTIADPVESLMRWFAKWGDTLVATVLANRRARLVAAGTWREEDERTDLLALLADAEQRARPRNPKHEYDDYAPLHADAAREWNLSLRQAGYAEASDAVAGAPSYPRLVTMVTAIKERDRDPDDDGPLDLPGEPLDYLGWGAFLPDSAAKDNLRSLQIALLAESGIPRDERISAGWGGWSVGVDWQAWATQLGLARGAA